MSFSRWIGGLCAGAMLLSLTAPPGQAATASSAETLILVGLTYDGGALSGANLQNKVGSGYQLGYLDEERVFHSLGETGQTAISVVKTENVSYGSYNNYNSYSDQITTAIQVGRYHVLLETGIQNWATAQAEAQRLDGFPAWVEGEYQIRRGSYLTREAAQQAATAVSATATVTDSGDYGLSVVKTGTADILFQFDGGGEQSLTVEPQVSGGQKAETYFKNRCYYGSFQYDRKAGGDITVSNLVEQTDYINCVISREMSSSWPLEALKAQAVCARNYCERSVSGHKKDPFDICSSTHCQAYYGMEATNARTRQAATETAGLRAWYKGELAQTYYFASDGGGTEDVRNVWGSQEDLPYLRGVIDPYEETISSKISYWNYEQTFTAEQLNDKVKTYLHSKGFQCADIVDFQVTELSATGNVKSISFTDSNGKKWPFTQRNAANFRSVLGLKSIRYQVTRSGGETAAGSAYQTTGGGSVSLTDKLYAIGGSGSVGQVGSGVYVITGSGTTQLGGSSSGTEGVIYTIRSSGYGHNVGMSQWGAYAMAQQGKTFRDILTFYYPGIEID